MRTEAEARKLLIECWADAGCSIDVDLFDEDNAIWEATLYIDSNLNEIRSLLSCKADSPAKSVEDLMRDLLANQEVLDRLERC